MKTCNICGVDLSIDKFYSKQAACKACVKIKARKYYATHKEQQDENTKRWARLNPERAREIKATWREKNLVAVKEYARYRRAIHPEVVYLANTKYRKANLHVYSTARAKRRAAELQATPIWAQKDLIEVFYEFSALLGQATGAEYEVDHVIPLQGVLVSGLHVETNLRVIPKHDNRVKANKFEGAVA